MRRNGRFLILSGGLLLALALLLTAYNLWDQRRAAEAVRTALVQLLPQIQPSSAPSEGDGEAEPDMVLRTVEQRRYSGVLSIPALDLSLPVAWDWSFPTLKTSPCRYAGSLSTQDLVIAGHNYPSHFGRLNELEPGDSVQFTDLTGRVLSYTVVELETLEKTAVEEMTSGIWDLTLFTCTVGGSARLAVRCRLS